MRDPSLQASVGLIDEVSRMPPVEAIRYLFDRYRTAQSASRDELVLALIGEVITQQSARAHRGCITEARRPRQGRLMLALRKVPRCTCSDCRTEVLAPELPEPEVSGDDAAAHHPVLAAAVVWSVLGMCLGAGLLLLSFLIIAFHHAQGTLAPASTLDGLRWGMAAFLASLVAHAACLIAFRVLDARS